MPLEVIVGVVMMVALMVYMLTGGADFGGGVWDLLAFGPRARAQRHVVSEAIGPIWEANHVWLILVVVLLFVCFPTGFAAITTALHIPLTIMLIGVVLRGSAFVFRSYDPRHPDETVGPWRLVFAIASTVTPVTLGISLGAVASGRMRLDPETGLVQTDFFSEWFAAFPLALGLYTLALMALLAAVYLVLETDDPALKADFRRRALASGAVSGVLAFATLGLAEDGAPAVWNGLTGQWWSLPFQVLTGLVAVGALVAVWRQRDRLAQVLVGGQVLAIMGGFGASWYPYLIAPDLTLAAAAAPDAVLRPVLIALASGSLLLLPAFVWLYRVFKTRPTPSSRTPENRTPA